MCLNNTLSFGHTSLVNVLINYENDRYTVGTTITGTRNDRCTTGFTINDRYAMVTNLPGTP